MPSVTALMVHSWRLESESLLLTLDDGGEASLVCSCGRHHWSVTQVRESLASGLHARCHACGTLLHLPFAAKNAT